MGEKLEIHLISNIDLIDVELIKLSDHQLKLISSCIYEDQHQKEPHKTLNKSIEDLKTNNHNYTFKITYASKDCMVFLEFGFGIIILNYSTDIENEISTVHLNILKKWHKFSNRIFLGFETEIHIRSLENSILETISDPSLFPIIYVDNNTKKEFSMNNEFSFERLKLLNFWLDLLN